MRKLIKLSFFFILVSSLFFTKANAAGEQHDLLEVDWSFKSFFGKFVLLGLCWTFSFHILNELRHLFWDAGYGFDLKVVRITGILVFIGSFLLTILFYLLGKSVF